MQLLVGLGCAAWLPSGGSFNLLFDVLAMGAFVLTQGIRYQQRPRERALHLKLDELVLAISGTRDELAGVGVRSEAGDA